MHQVVSADGRVAINLHDVTAAIPRGPWAERWGESRAYRAEELQATITFRNGVTVTFTGDQAAAVLAGLQQRDAAPGRA